MATGGNRDVTLAVGIKTSGEEALRSLASEVQNLAKRGGDAAPAYQQLANELQRLSSQAGALEAFKALAKDVERLNVEQREASKAAAELSTQLERQRQVVQQAADAESKAQVALKQSRDALAGKRYELTQLNIDTDRAGKSEQDYLEKSRRLKQEILDLTVEVRSRRDAMRAATTEVDRAEAAESKLSTQYERSAKAAGQIDTALAAQRDAMTRAAAAAEQLGLSVADVAAAEEKLLATQQKIVGSVAEARVNAAREQAEADRLAIREQQALAELYERGRVALIAETAAIEEASEASRRYARFQAEVADEVRRLEVEQDRATQAMRETIAATTKANEEALALSANADRIRFYARAFDELAEKERRAAQEAEDLRNASARAAEALREAFGTTGVRSLQAVQDEVAKVGQSLNLLQANYRAGAISAQDLARATSSAQVRLAQLRQEAQNIPSLPNVFERMNSTINDLIGKFGSLSASIATLGFAVKPVLDANIELETLRRTLTFVTGSAAEAGRQIEFLREVSLRNGLAVGALSDSFSLFAASMVKSGQSLQTTQTLFAGVAGAAGQLGISSERVSNILLALGQVANKGKVSLEELQGQIGESLPGAMKLAADSVGLTSDELRKMLETGQLLSKDFLPLFGRALVDTFAAGAPPVKGLAQAFNDLRTQATITAQGLADTAAYRVLTSAVQSLANNLDTLVSTLGSAAKAFAVFKALDMAREFLGIKAAAEAAAAGKLKDVAATQAAAAAERTTTAARVAGTAAVTAQTEALVANTLAKRANAAAAAGAVGPMDALSTTLGKVGAGMQAATSRVGSFVNALGGPFGLALTGTIAFSDQLGGALARLAARFTGVLGEIEKYEKAQKAAAEADRRAAEAAQRAAEDRARSTIRILEDNRKLIESAERQVKVSNDLAAAKKTEGEAAVEMARLTDSEIRVREAQLQATRDNEKAQRDIVAAYDAQIAAEAKVRQVIIESVGGVEKMTATERDRIKTINETIRELEAKRAKTVEAADKERSLAAAAELSVEKLKDQSGALEQNVKELEVKRATLAQVIELEKQGVVTAQTVNAARQAEAQALGRVNESLRQRIEKQEQQNKLRQADAQLTRAKLEQNAAEERTLEALAAANGDLYGVESSRIRQREIELRQTRNVIQEDIEEAQGKRKAAQDELKNRADLSEAQRRDLELKIKLADASEAEARARMRNTSAVEAEIRAMRQRLAVAAQQPGVAPGVNPTAGVIGSGADKFRGSVSNGGGMMAGQGGGPVDASYVFDLWARFQQGRVSPDELPAIRNALAVAEANARLGGPGSVSPEGKADDQAWIGRLKQIIAALDTNSLGGNSGGSSGGSMGGTGNATGGGLGTGISRPSSASSAPAAPAATSLQPIQLFLEGRSVGTVDVAPGSVDTLQRVLAQLAQSSGRAA